MGHSYPVNVVGHAAVAQQCGTEPGRILANLREVDLVIRFVEKDILTIQPPLGQMMRHAEKHRPRHSRHITWCSHEGISLAETCGLSPGSPRFSIVSCEGLRGGVPRVGEPVVRASFATRSGNFEEAVIGPRR